MSCNLGIHSAIKKILNDKPWFKYKQGDSIIEILDSPTKKINNRTSIGVANTVADAINKTINNGYKNIGNIVYPEYDSNKRGIVRISPSIKQLNLINSKNEEEINKIQQEVDEENRLKDFDNLAQEGNVYINSEQDIVSEDDFNPNDESEVETNEDFSPQDISTNEVAKEIEKIAVEGVKKAKELKGQLELWTDKDNLVQNKNSNNINFQNGVNEGNLIRISELQEEMKVKFGEIILDSENKISGFKNNTEQNTVFNPEHVTREEANQIYDKSKKTKEDRNKLAIYFATYFVNRTQDVETPLYLGFNRIQRSAITKPIILITKDNKRKNPFFQYNNMVVVGIEQLSKMLKIDDGISFEKWEETVDSVAQEEIIHLFADYLLDDEEIDAIYSEMTQSDINHIKSIYGNNNITEDQIVHEYLRMVVQQEVFGRTTEEHTVTMSEYTLIMLSSLLDKIQEFLKKIIGSKNTTKAIEDLIAFTKGEFSEEFDTKLKNKVFKQGQVLEASLNEILSETTSGNENRIKQIEELFESNSELANAVYEALGVKPKANIILPIGTSGSGKSTFIKSLPQENLVVIEPDAMRVEFTGDMNDKSKDKEIYEEAAKRAVTAIKQGKQVVFDTTNLTKDKRLPFIEAIKKEIPNANIQYKLMELNPELAKQRIKADITAGKNRANVPDATIDRHAESYKQMLEDIKSEPISNFEITPQQKATAQQLYSRYLDTIGVTDIGYHHSESDLESFTTFSEGYFTKELKKKGTHYKEADDIVFFVKKPLTEEFMSKRKFTGTWGLKIPNTLQFNAGEKVGEGVHPGIDEGIKNAVDGKYDAVDFGRIRDNKTWSEVIVITNPNNAVKLGSKQGIEDFQKFINKNPKSNNQELEWQTNEIKLKTKYPEITYQDFVSLTEQEREKLLTCL